MQHATVEASQPGGHVAEEYVPSERDDGGVGVVHVVDQLLQHVDVREPPIEGGECRVEGGVSVVRRCGHM